MKKLFYTIWICVYPPFVYTFIQLLLGMGAGIVAAFYASFTGNSIDFAGFISENALVITAVSAVLAFVPLILFFYLDNKKRGAVAAKEKKILDFVMAVLGGIGIAIVLNVIIGLTGIINFDKEFLKASEAITSPPLSTVIVCAGIIIPIVEEVIFRGLIFNRIRYSYGLLPAIISSSLFFGIYHANLTQGVYATVLGFCLAYAYYKTKNLLIPVLTHIGANVSVTVYGEIGSSLQTEADLVSSSKLVITANVCLLLSAVFAILGILYFKARKVEAE